MSRYCSQCGKAHKVCFCSAIVRLESAIELIILQHPTEQNRPLGTARILALSLPNSRLLIGEDFTTHPELNCLLAEEEVQHMVLYPSQQSICASSKPWVGRSHKLRVILLDGTWKKAYKMWQLSTNLHGLPCLHLPTDLEGNYRIRKAPSENSLSTVEAGYHLLQLAQPEQDYSPLLTVFSQMIDTQIQHMPPEIFAKHYLQDQ